MSYFSTEPRADLRGTISDSEARVYGGAFVVGANPICITLELVLQEWLPNGEDKMSKSLGNVLDPLVVITMWGGEKDTYDCGPPLGLCADYRPSTQAGSNYFSSKPTVVHVACTGDHGHRWPATNRDAFNLWALKTMASHPKGSNPKAFKLTAPPEGYSCKLGPFTGLY